MGPAPPWWTGGRCVCSCVLRAAVCAPTTPTQLNGVQPTVTVDDAVEAEEIMKSNPEFQKVVAERYGITNMDVLAVDPWYNGERFETKENTPIGRQMMMFLYMRMGDPDDNFYAHPLDLVVDIDLYTKKVIKMFMYDRVPRIPELPRNYHRRLMDRPFRDDIKPLHILQPEGPSFTVRWQPRGMTSVCVDALLLWPATTPHAGGWQRGVLAKMEFPCRLQLQGGACAQQSVVQRWRPRAPHPASLVSRGNYRALQRSPYALCTQVRL